MSAEWEETKKEFSVNEKGEYIPIHVTMERTRKKILGFDKKDFWDQIIKSVGIVAIVIPLILFKCSRDADIEERKDIMQLELFSNVLSDVQRIILLPDTSAEFKNSKNRIDIEYYSKMMMLGKDSIMGVYRELKDTINMYSLVAQSNHILDTIIKHLNTIRLISKLSNKTELQKDTLTKRAVALFSKAAIQWATIYQLIFRTSTGVKAEHYTWFSNIIGALNQTEPLMWLQLNDTLDRTQSLKRVDSLSENFNKLTVKDRSKPFEYEKQLKNQIESYYHRINNMMINVNKILSRKT